MAVAEQRARCGDSPRPRGLDGRPRIDGWIWGRAADHRSANSQLDRPRVVQLPYTPQLKSSVAVLSGTVSGRVCIAGGQAEGLGGCVAEPGRPIGPDVPPTRLVLDPGGPDSLARGCSSRIAKRYQLQNVSGLRAPKPPRTIPAGSEQGRSGSEHQPFCTQPPSTFSTWPVTLTARHRYKAASAMSSTVWGRRSGTLTSSFSCIQVA